MEKIIALTLALTLTNIAHSADWTPAFAYLQNQHANHDHHTLEIIMSNTFASNIHAGNYKKIKLLTKYAETGNYPKIAPTYRADILPAKVYKDPNRDTVLRAVIPLKNATLYGLPLKSLTYEYYCLECDGIGFYATFAPMTITQYRSLTQKIKFEQYNEEEDVCGNETSASFSGNHKALHLNLHIGC